MKKVIERVRYHLAPKKNWMNDPNGTIWQDGFFHVFYQYNPSGANWGNIHWAHVKSRDNREFINLPIALKPKGEAHCFSGCAVKTDEGTKIFYTSVPDGADGAAKRATVRMYKCDDALKRFTPTDFEMGASYSQGLTEWRDPFIFESGGEKYMALSAQKEGSVIVCYKAKDSNLCEFDTVQHILYKRDDCFFECPNIVFFGDTAVLIYSDNDTRTVRYSFGTLNNAEFTEKGRGVIDCGENCFYATNVAVHDGIVYLYGWLAESLIGKDSPDGVRSGCLALVRKLEFDTDLKVLPICDDYFNPRYIYHAENCKGQTLRLQSCVGHVGFDAQDFTLTLCRNIGSPEKVTICRKGATVTVNRKHAIDADDRPLVMNCKTGTMRFELYLDGSACELYATTVGKVLSFRFYAFGNRTEIATTGIFNVKMTS